MRNVHLGPFVLASLRCNERMILDKATSPRNPTFALYTATRIFWSYFMTRTLSLFALAFCACLAPLTATAELAGTWTLTINTPRGVQNPKLEVIETDGVYAGTYHSLRGPLELNNVQTDGRSFSFDIQITVPIGDIDVTYTGEIDGDNMSGKVVNPRGEVPFSGQRNQ